MRVLHDEISTVNDSLYSDLKSMEDRLRGNLNSAMKLLRDELRYDLKSWNLRSSSPSGSPLFHASPYRGEADVLATSLHT